MSGAVMPNKLEKIWKMKSDTVKLLLGKKVSAQQPQNEMQTCVPSQSTKCDANTIAAMLLAAKLSELSRNFSWQQLLTSVIEKSSEFHTQLTKFASFYSLMSWESSQRKRSNDNMLKSTKKQSQLSFLLFFFREVPARRWFSCFIRDLNFLSIELTAGDSLF